MNIKNLIMWVIIVLLSVGLFNMFQDPNKISSERNSLPFSNFLNEVEAGRVVEVQIQGNNISGILADGKKFKTYSPNYPELVDKLSSKGVSIQAAPTEDKMPSLLGILLSWFPMLLLIGVWIFFLAASNADSFIKLAKSAPENPGVPLAIVLNFTSGPVLIFLMWTFNIASLPIMSDVEEAKDKVMMGAERRSMVMSEDEKKLTAYHEGGHAIVALNEKASDPIHKATIIPRGRALGMVMRLPERDQLSVTREKMHADIAVAMGGRIAEEIIFGHDKVTSGASSDIDMVTKMAKNMVTKYGMSTELGTIAYGENEEEVFLGRSVTKQQNMSEETAKKIDIEVKKIVDKGYERARKVLTEKIDDLHKIAKALLIYETMSGDEIRDLILKNIKPTRSFKDEKEDDGKESSALGSLGLKPKPAV